MMDLPAEFPEESSAFLRLLLKNEGSVLFLIDLKNNRHQFFTANPALGKAPGSHLEDLIGPEYLAEFYTNVSRALLRDEPDFSMSCTVITEDAALSARCHASIVVREPDDTDGDIRITGLLLLSDKLVQCRESTNDVVHDCPHLDRQKRLMANISHEMRTPMAGALGLIDLALDTGPEPEQKQYLLSIRECTNSLLRVLNDVIDFSRINEGKITLESVDFDPVELMADILRLFALDACRKNIELTCYVAPDLPDCLVGDPGRIRQVLINLVANAIKFTPRGEIHINVGISRTLRHHAILEIKVQDSGIGIKNEDLIRIFNPFEQADFSNTRQFGGVGLGLSISNNLVNAMHGIIGVVSTPGKGSEFTVNIPLGIKLTAASEAPPEKISGRMLICTPHPSLSRTITSYLADIEDIAAIHTPLEAKAEIIASSSGATPYDIVFWDTDMSVPDGLEAEWIKNIPCLVIISSALRFSADSAKCKTLGINTRLCKPFTNRDLARAITHALENRRSVANTETLQDFVRDISVGDDYSVSTLFNDGHQPTILVVDDDYFSRTNIVTTLERSGYKVHSEDNGESGVEQFKNGVFDAIVMDLQMPVMDGLAATKAMRLMEMRHSWVMSSQTSFVPIIGLTADVQNSSREAAELAGMNRILVKPVTRKELLTTLEEEIRERVSERLIG